MPRFVDIANKKFGNLVAKEHVGGGDWKCECKCGTIKIFRSFDLRRGFIKTCGSSLCKRHGSDRSPRALKRYKIAESAYVSWHRSRSIKPPDKFEDIYRPDQFESRKFFDKFSKKYSNIVTDRKDYEKKIKQKIEKKYQNKVERKMKHLVEAKKKLTKEYDGVLDEKEKQAVITNLLSDKITPNNEDMKRKAIRDIPSRGINLMYLYRRKLGLSMMEVGRRMGVSRESVRLWEQQLSLPNLEHSILLRKVLNMTDMDYDSHFKHVKKAYDQANKDRGVSISRTKQALKKKRAKKEKPISLNVFNLFTLEIKRPGDRVRNK